MVALAEKRCVPCRGGVEPLKGQDITERAKQLRPGWHVIDEHHLEREFLFENFRQALDLVNEIGELAERENHHPNVLLTYGKVVIHLWTHKIDGLHENDFILAAKIDALGPGTSSDE